MKRVAKEWTFRGSGKEPYVTRQYEDRSLSCNCMGWTRRTGPDGERRCKHTTWVIQGVADEISIAVVDYAKLALSAASVPVRGIKSQQPEDARALVGVRHFNL